MIHRKWQLPWVFLHRQHHGQYRKAKKIWSKKLNPSVWKVSNMLLGKRWGQLIIAPEGMNDWAKQKLPSVVDMSGGESKVWCCKEQYCIGTWNVGSMNQGKLEVAKQEMARLNIGILGISELKWMGMGEFNSDDHYIYYCGQESLRRNAVALTVNKKVWNAVLWCILKNNRMISVHFQDKPFNIRVIKPMPKLLMPKKLVFTNSMKT